MKQKTGITIAIIIIIAIGAFFIFGNSGSEIVPAENTEGAQNHNIAITDFSYSPKELTINVGDTVVWTNYDSITHTVTSDSGNQLDSSLLTKGQIYYQTFNEAGTFDYHCTPHPYMKGKIIVESK